MIFGAAVDVVVAVVDCFLKFIILAVLVAVTAFMLLLLRLPLLLLL